MARTLTNEFSLSYGIEPTLGADPTVWFQLEPNANGLQFGATISTIARNPISKSRQRLKGTTVDLDSQIQFEHDLTMSAFRDFIEGFVHATGINSDVTNLAATDADTTLDEYTGLTALSAAQADKFEIDTLIWVTGGTVAANNGLKVVDADIATSATAITVVENLTTETASFKISLAGHQIATADVVTWDWDAGTALATMNLTGIVAALQALGLTVGQRVHIGSPDGSGGVQRAFENSAANDMFGYATVSSFSGADDVIFKKVDAALKFDDLTDPTTAVDILFGEFIRNVDVDNAAFIERSFMFEGSFPNLLAGPADGFQYSKGNRPNTMAIDLPLTDKATITFGFIGTDTDNPVGSGSRKSGASTAAAPTETASFNTTADIMRLRVHDTDDAGLTTDFKNVTLTLDNQISGEKVLAQLGPKFINFGNFLVNITATVLFSNADVITRIRSNTTVSADFVVRNGDGAISFDIPSMTLGSGNRNFPENESITIDIPGEAFKDATLLTSLGVSIFPTAPQPQA